MTKYCVEVLVFVEDGNEERAVDQVRDILDEVLPLDYELDRVFS